MVTTNSADSASVEPSIAAFNGERVVNLFPRHDVVKLADATYIQWKQQIKLVLDGYDLLGFLDGIAPLPSRFVHTPDGVLALNPSASVFKQQDQLLTSWLFSTIDVALLPSFTDARLVCDVWTIATELFAADTGAKQSRLRHELHSLKKDEEKLDIILTRLPSEFEGVVSSPSMSTSHISLQRVVNALVECENRLHRATRRSLSMRTLLNLWRR